MAVGLGVGAVVDIAAAEQRLVLAVGHDGLAQSLRATHGQAHHVLGLDALAVVGEGEAPRRQRLQIGELFTLFAHGDGGVG